MSKANKTRKVQKKVRKLSVKDERLKHSVPAELALSRRKKIKENEKPEVYQKEDISPSLFFEFNSRLGPPFRVIIDTNFVNFSIQNKVDMFQGMIDLLLAKTFIHVTDCVIGELEKLGHRYNLALRLAKDPRIERLVCAHKGTYADDCIVKRVEEDRCYIVATNDKDLRRRLRKIPGVPIMFVTQHKYAIERMPDSMSNIPVSMAKIKGKNR